MPLKDMVEHLVGLQAQEIMPPYYGLWSRLDRFDPIELGRLLQEREVVRLWLMRGTLHLATVEDALAFKPLTQVVAERQHTGGHYGRRMAGVDIEALVETARELLAEGPVGGRELGRRLVQVTPRGVWGQRGQAKLATIQSWTGRELEPEPSIDDFVLRYLRAFGPASVADIQNWSGLTRLRQVVERLRDRLAVFQDESGRELFDLPDAPRPDPDVPAPVRLLGEYDNVLLGHADRARIIPPDFPWVAMLAPRRSVSNVLVDGMLRASWWLERDGNALAILAIRPFGRLSKRDRDEVEGEAQRMVDFAAGEATTRHVRFEDPVC
jgi:DNA glycosylase AlkZ-like